MYQRRVKSCRLIFLAFKCRLAAHVLFISQSQSEAAKEFYYMARSILIGPGRLLIEQEEI